MLLSRHEPSRSQLSARSHRYRRDWGEVYQEMEQLKDSFILPAGKGRQIIAPPYLFLLVPRCIPCDSHSARTKLGQDYQSEERHLPETLFEAGLWAVTAFR